MSYYFIFDYLLAPIQVQHRMTKEQAKFYTEYELKILFRSQLEEFAKLIHTTYKFKTDFKQWFQYHFQKGNLYMTLQARTGQKQNAA